MNPPHPDSMLRPPDVRAILAILAATAVAPVAAVDVSWSGFATAGYARSDSSYVYERFTDRDGTFKRDSIIGTQMNATFDPQWSATLQATIAPSVSDNERWDPTLTWAFLSFRPTNDLLFRAGKLRMPMYLFSENIDVSASYDVMHLPTEVYSTAPTTDFTGMSVSKTWTLGDGEMALEAYAGRTSRKALTGSSDSAETSTLRTRSGGVVLSFRQDDNVYRVGVQRAFITIPTSAGAISGLTPPGDNPGNATGTPVDSGSGGNALQGDIDTRVFIVGFDQALGNDFRLIGEYARRHAPDLVISKNTRGAYVTLFKRVANWTPYVTLGRLLTDSNARTSSSNGGYDDQTSWALGTSYRLSPGQKIKAEWMQVRTGGSSTLTDVGTPGHQTINIVSLSYSLAF